MTEDTRSDSRASNNPSDQVAGFDGEPSAGSVAEAVHSELQATEELPVERAAGRWIGEAQAVAADAASPGLADDVVRERLVRVGELLSHVEETGHDMAEERIQRARQLVGLVSEDT